MNPSGFVIPNPHSLAKRTFLITNDKSKQDISCIDFAMFHLPVNNSINCIKLVLSCAQEFPTVFPIQMAATACLFNLSKAELGNKIHPGILRKIVQADLDAMETFPQHQQLQKNVLLTMYSHRILQEVGQI